METVLITGANRGIGLELVKSFLGAGNHVIATCRQPGDAEDLCSLQADSNLTVYELEVTDGESVEQLRRELDGQPLDVLINNAGIMGGVRQSLDDMDYAAWIEAFEVNTLAPFRLITTFQENLLRSKRPRAITLSSQMGSLSRKSKGSYAYRSSKAAVNKVMQVLSMELEAGGIIVCPVHPGWVRTDMGGTSAYISAEESGAGIFKLVEGLTMEQSGRFWTWDGEEHPW